MLKLKCSWRRKYAAPTIDPVLTKFCFCAIFMEARWHMVFEHVSRRRKRCRELAASLWKIWASRSNEARPFFPREISPRSTRDFYPDTIPITWAKRKIILQPLACLKTTTNLNIKTRRRLTFWKECETRRKIQKSRNDCKETSNYPRIKSEITTVT